MSEMMSTTPPTTLLFTIACVAIFVIQSLEGSDSIGCAIGAYPVLYQFQFYRIVSSAFCHGGLQHVGMNMLSFFFMGASLERLFGTVPFAYLLMLIVLLAGFAYVNVCWVLAWSLSEISWLRYYSVGFSGVIFANAAQESFLSTAPTRRLFGLITVPTRLYPWALLVLLQVLMPNISFLGHVTGLVLGLLHVRGKLQWAVPSVDAFQRIEDLPAFAGVRRMGGFVPTPDIDRVTQVAGGGESLLRMTLGVLKAVFAPCIACARPAAASVAGVFGRRTDRYAAVPTADDGDGGGGAIPDPEASPTGRTYGRGAWGSGGGGGGSGGGS